MRINGLVIVALIILLIFIGAYKLGYRHAIERATFKHCDPVSSPVASWEQYQACAAEFERWLR